MEYMIAVCCLTWPHTLVKRRVQTPARLRPRTTGPLDDGVFRTFMGLGYKLETFSDIEVSSFDIFVISIIYDIKLKLIENIYTNNYGK